MLLTVMLAATMGLAPDPAAADPAATPLKAFPDTTVSPNYSAGPTGRAEAIVEANGRIYIGGDFTVVGGQTRNRLAAVNSQTGALDPNWNPNANGVVYALAVGLDGSIYAGGVFTNVGGASRARLARLDPATGRALPWNPGASAQVRALAVAPITGRVFAGGTFTTVGGQSRRALAAINDDGTMPSWRADTESVRDIKASPDGTRLYVGGNFTSIGGVRRNFVAAVDTGTGAVSPWTPTLPYRVFALGLSADGARLYTAGGGPFNSGGNQAAAYNTSQNGGPLWDTQADGDWQAIEIRGTVVYGGGHFNFINGQRRNHIAALDAVTGALMPWNPGADSTWGVFRLVRGANSLLVGGDFFRIGGRQQPHFARFSPV
jgi:trimeric autotransporter adhesin